MPYSYTFGDVVVSSEEMNEKLSLGVVADYAQELRRDPGAEIVFRDGVVSQMALAADAGPHAFEPIDIGKPLSVEILGYYTGDLPWIFGKNLMLVGSAVKAIDDYNAQVRAVNQIVSDVGERKYLRPRAEAEGEPIVLYTPALVPDLTVVDLTLTIDRFQEELFGYLGALLKTAGGLPLFFVSGPAGGGVAATALLAGSVVAEKAGELGKLLFNSTTFLSGSLEFRFDHPGFLALQPSAIKLYDEKDKGKLDGYEPVLIDGGTPQQRFVLQNTTGKTYDGPAPYIILNYDGRQRENLDNFKAHQATAAVLERFVGGKDTGGQVVAILQEAMGLFNDSTFREKAIATQRDLGVANERIELLKKNKKPKEYEADPAYKVQIEIKKNLEKRLQAYNSNIRQEIFKLQ